MIQEKNDFKFPSFECRNEVEGLHDILKDKLLSSLSK